MPYHVHHDMASYHDSNSNSSSGSNRNSPPSREPHYQPPVMERQCEDLNPDPRFAGPASIHSQSSLISLSSSSSSSSSSSATPPPLSTLPLWRPTPSPSAAELGVSPCAPCYAPAAPQDVDMQPLDLSLRPAARDEPIVKRARQTGAGPEHRLSFVEKGCGCPRPQRLSPYPVAPQGACRSPNPGTTTPPTRLSLSRTGSPYFRQSPGPAYYTALNGPSGLEPPPSSVIDSSSFQVLTSSNCVLNDQNIPNSSIIFRPYEDHIESRLGHSLSASENGQKQHLEDENQKQQEQQEEEDEELTYMDLDSATPRHLYVRGNNKNKKNSSNSSSSSNNNNNHNNNNRGLSPSGLAGPFRVTYDPVKSSDEKMLPSALEGAANASAAPHQSTGKTSRKPESTAASWPLLPQAYSHPGQFYTPSRTFVNGIDNHHHHQQQLQHHQQQQQQEQQQQYNNVREPCLNTSPTMLNPQDKHNPDSSSSRSFNAPSSSSSSISTSPSSPKPSTGTNSAITDLSENPSVVSPRLGTGCPFPRVHVNNIGMSSDPASAPTHYTSRPPHPHPQPHPQHGGRGGEEGGDSEPSERPLQLVSLACGGNKENSCSEDADLSKRASFFRTADLTAAATARMGSLLKQDCKAAENALLFTSTVDVDMAKGNPLNFLISRMLVENMEEHGRGCHFDVHKDSEGHNKIRMKLVDLIEMQVEQSLKA